MERNVLITSAKEAYLVKCAFRVVAEYRVTLINFAYQPVDINYIIKSRFDAMQCNAMQSFVQLTSPLNEGIFHKS